MANVFPADGNVGIGTTTPAYLLQIVGARQDAAQTSLDVRAENQAGEAKALNIVLTAGTPAVLIRTAAAGASPRLSFAADSSTPHLTILPNGNVGIGATQPDARLDVGGEVRVTSTAPLFTLRETDTGVLWQQSADGDRWALRRNGVDRVVVNSAGQVGIGATTPLLTVDARGGVLIDNGLRILLGTTDTAPLQLGGGSGIAFGGTYAADGTTANFGGVDAIKESATSGDTAGALRLFSREAGAPGLIRERVRVTSGGRVGIDTPAPNYKLDVSGPAGTDDGIRVVMGNIASLRLQRTDSGGGGAHTYIVRTDADAKFKIIDETSGGSRLVIGVDGKVGIGLDAPQQNLSVNTGLNLDQANSNDGSLASALTFGGGSGEGIGSKRTATGNQYGLDFWTANQVRLSIKQNGNVGINTVNPQTRFHVVGGDIRGDGSLFMGTRKVADGGGCYYAD